MRARDDSELVAAVQAGDSASYGELYERYESKLYNYAYRIAGNPDDARDAMQEALATVWKRWERIQHHPNPQALVLKICINAACDMLRRRIRLSQHEASQPQNVEPTDPSPSANEELARQELKSEIMNAIGQLPANQAEAILMRFVQELPYEAIASAMGCREATVRTHIARGRSRLCQILAHLAPTQAMEVIK
jgi:RNA polymerase sigma-70 factor (ECF subfamily)